MADSPRYVHINRVRDCDGNPTAITPNTDGSGERCCPPLHYLYPGRPLERWMSPNRTNIGPATVEEAERMRVFHAATKRATKEQRRAENEIARSKALLKKYYHPSVVPEEINEDPALNSLDLKEVPYLTQNRVNGYPGIYR